MIALVFALLLESGRPPEPKMFHLTQQHLELLRKSIVLWIPMESGAPGVMLTPIGTGEEEIPPEAFADVARRAGIHVSEPMTQGEKAQVQQLMVEMPEALAQLLAHGKLEPGKYEYSNPLTAIPFASNILPAELASYAKAPSVSFTVTAQHLALIRNANYRGLFVDGKRPYGDMTYFELDMADILGEKVEKGGSGPMSDGQQQRLWKLHTETLPALQIYLQKAAMAVGEYETISVYPAMPGM